MIKQNGKQFNYLWSRLHSLTSLHCDLSPASISKPFRHVHDEWLWRISHIWLQPPLSIEHKSGLSHVFPSDAKTNPLNEQSQWKLPNVFIQCSLHSWRSVKHSSMSMQLFWSVSNVYPTGHEQMKLKKKKMDQSKAITQFWLYSNWPSHRILTDMRTWRLKKTFVNVLACSFIVTKLHTQRTWAAETVKWK